MGFGQTTGIRKNNGYMTATGDQAVKLEEKRNMFLSLVRKYPGISRRDCAIAMRVSTFYASKLVPELVDAGIVTEEDTPAKICGRGRPSKPLFINPEYEYFAGIDLEARSWRMVIANFQGDIIHTFIRPFKACSNSYEYCSQLENILAEAIDNAGEKWEKVKAVGIGAPGFLNDETGIIENYEILPEFKNIPLRDICKTVAGKPVFIQNNVYNLATYDLLKRPESEGRSVIHVALRSGISAALNLNGVVYKGSSNMAGEVGLSLFSNLEMLQRFAGLSGLNDELPELPAEFWSGESEAVDNALNNQEYFKTLDKAMSLFSVTLANISSFLDPDELVIYSTIFQEPNRLWDMLQTGFDRCRHEQGLKPADLRPAEASEFTPANGAAIFALENTYTY